MTSTPNAAVSHFQRSNPDSPDASPTPTPDTPQYKYVTPWCRDVSCPKCNSVYQQLNPQLGAKALGQENKVLRYCQTPSEPIRTEAPFAILGGGWTPKSCPNCEALERARVEAARREGFYDQSIRQDLAIVEQVVDGAERPLLKEALSIAFDEGDSVLVLDKMTELDAETVAALRATGELSLVVGGPLAALRGALGGQQFGELLAAGKIVSSNQEEN